jgi:hypothetical protein
MLLHYCCRWSAEVAIRAVEIQRVVATLAERAAIDRFGCVISHIIIVVTLLVRALGNRCATLERETFSLAGSPDSNSSVGQASLFPTALCEFPIGREESWPAVDTKVRAPWWRCRRTPEGIDFESALGGKAPERDGRSASLVPP